MKFEFFAIGMIVLTSGGATLSKAQGSLGYSCNQPANLSTLSGTYTSIDKIAINSSGAIRSITELSLNVKSDAHIDAKKTWILSKGFGHKAADGTKTKGDTEALIGVIKDCELAFAETKENGIYFGRLLNDGTIRMTMIQSGVKPVVHIENLLKTN